MNNIIEGFRGWWRRPYSWGWGYPWYSYPYYTTYPNDYIVEKPVYVTQKKPKRNVQHFQGQHIAPMHYFMIFITVIIVLFILYMIFKKD
jgi:hypothetical protein